MTTGFSPRLRRVNDLPFRSLSCNSGMGGCSVFAESSGIGGMRDSEEAESAPAFEAHANAAVISNMAERPVKIRVIRFDVSEFNHISCAHTLIAGEGYPQTVHGVVHVIGQVNILPDGLQEIGLLPVA